MTSRRRAALVLAIAVAGSAALALGMRAFAASGCANAIACENQLAGTAPSVWDVSNGAGDSTIQGYATDISYNQGDTASFKVNAPVGVSYRIDIYRVGWYQGNGARLVAQVGPFLGAAQPACLTDATTGLVDCGNWSVSATWPIPADAVSGVYIARLVRLDTLGASHMVFIVRADSSRSDVLVQTSDQTWQAYNDWGGQDLYGGGGPAPDGRAYKVSYNRPLRIAGDCRLDDH